MVEAKRAGSNLQQSYREIRAQLGQQIVGLDEVVKLLLTGIFSGGHCLLIGVPGLAKTLLISSVAKLLELDFSRIQFTPDLMPNDITGAEVIVDDRRTGERRFEFLKGPIFANIVLADEINRTQPKTQASLMEAMEENQVTSLGKRFDLAPPFFVLATQNPIEQEGTYPLPAAQLDRFIFNINVGYPDRGEEKSIVRLTTQPGQVELTPILTKAEVLEIIATVRGMVVPPEIAEYATTIARRSRPHDEKAPARIKKYVAHGGSPRAAQSLVMGAKALALMRGASRPSFADVRELVAPVFRHRIVVNFHGAADGVTAENLLEDIINSVPAPDRPEPQRKKKGLFSFLAKSSS